MGRRHWEKKRERNPISVSVLSLAIQLQSAVRLFTSLLRHHQPNDEDESNENKKRKACVRVMCTTVLLSHAVCTNVILFLLFPFLLFSLSPSWNSSQFSSSYYGSCICVSPFPFRFGVFLLLLPTTKPFPTLLWMMMQTPNPGKIARGWLVSTSYIQPKMQYIYMSVPLT